jgi:hypothetical protein
MIKSKEVTNLTVDLDERINSIKEVENVEYDRGAWNDHYDGFEIITNKHSYKVLIDNGQSCCENWGYAISEDDPENFIGAKLLAINITDTQLNTFAIDALPDTNKSYYEGDIQFVSFSTNMGIFQIALYNEHNGYYGHEILLLQDDDAVFQNVL